MFGWHTLLTVLDTNDTMRLREMVVFVLFCFVFSSLVGSTVRTLLCLFSFSFSFFVFFLANHPSLIGLRVWSGHRLIVGSLLR